MHWSQHDAANADPKGLKNGRAWIWDKDAVNRELLSMKWSSGSPNGKDGSSKKPVTGEGSQTKKGAQKTSQAEKGPQTTQRLTGRRGLSNTERYRRER